MIVNHTHHDIGFNDYQTVALRQQGEFVRDALDLIEATADRQPAEQFRWTCEVTGPLMRYLREAGQQEQERLRYWQQRGAVEVTAMQYNLTPLLTPEQMRRSLYPVRVLREEIGLEVKTAMQDDVNGISWMFADLLSSIGIDFLTLAVNQSRGRAPRPFPGGFWWEGPAGDRLLTWNGFHYLFGRSQAKLGDWRFVEHDLQHYVDVLDASDDFPFDTLYAEATHPMRVDNGPPDHRMAEFVQRWNAEGRHPLLEFATPRMFHDYLVNAPASTLPVQRGDWTDWWADGVASSAYETAVSRANHELLAIADTLGAWLIAAGKTPDLAESLVDQIYEKATLFEEHTWGAFSSIDAPDSLFTRAQWNKKAGFAYEAAMESHDVITRNARQFGEIVGHRAEEGRFNLGDLATADAYPEASRAELLILNTLPYDRTALIEVPEFRAGGAPAGMLESFFPRGVPWGGPPDTPLTRVRASLPASGYIFVSEGDSLDDGDLAIGKATIENEYYRVEVDAELGCVTSWFDKVLRHEFADELDEGFFGDLIHEVVDSAAGRDALYLQDFGSWDFGYWQVDPPFDRVRSSTVTGVQTRLESGLAVMELGVSLRGTRSATLRIALPSRERTLQVDWTVDKAPQVEPEAVYVLFPVRLDGQRYTADIGGVALTPGRDQIPGAATDFLPIRRWVDVSDNERGVTLCSLDAPLIQAGGINTNRISEEFEPRRPALVSWAMNNHWMVNFRASQDGKIELRYRLTTHTGECSAETAHKFAESQSVPPVVLRDYVPKGPQRASIFDGVSQPGIELTAKPESFGGEGIVLRVKNLTDRPIARPFGELTDTGRMQRLSLLEEAEDGGLDELPARGELSARWTTTGER